MLVRLNYGTKGKFLELNVELWEYFISVEICVNVGGGLRAFKVGYCELLLILRINLYFCALDSGIQFTVFSIYVV